MNAAVALVVFSGGRGTRLGGAIKPLLRTERGVGPTILEVIERTFTGRVAEVVVVAPAALVPKLAAVSSARIVEDRGRGPGEALLDAARSVGVRWMLAVAGDQPRPSLALYERLLARAEARPGIDAVAISEGGAPFPTFALYRRAALLGITRIDGSEGISLRGVLGLIDLETIPAELLDAAEKEALLDADTPEEAAALGLALTSESNG